MGDVGAPAPRVAGLSSLVLVAAGAHARVYRALREGAPHDVILKAYAPGSAARWQRELSVLAALGPPATPALLAHGIGDDGAPYLVMDVAPGASLATRLDSATSGRPSPVQAVAWLSTVTRAVAALHAGGVAHLELQPEHVLVGYSHGRAMPEGEHAAASDSAHSAASDSAHSAASDSARAPDVATLVDLGSARRLTERGTGAYAGAGAPSWNACSAAYAAPEVGVDDDAGAPADVYALGVMLFEALTGRLPFTGHPAHVRHAHRTRRPPQPSELVPEAWPLDDLVLRCLAKDPALRHRDASALLVGLEAVAASLAEASARAARPATAAATTSARVAVVRLPGAWPLVELRAALPPEAALARVDARGAVIAFWAARSAGAGVRAAWLAADQLATRWPAHATAAAVVHVGELQVREHARAPLLHGLALTELDALAAPDAAPAHAGAGPWLTAAAAAELDASEVTAAAAGFATWSSPALAGSDDREAPIQGREPLLAELVEHAVSGLASARPSLCTLVGDTGVGRSRLLAELARRLGARGVPVRRLGGRGLDVAGLRQGTGATSHPAAGAPGASVRGRAAIGALARELRATAPLVVLVDDVDLAGAAVLDALELTADAAEPAAFVVVATARPALFEARPTWGEREGALVRRVERLDDAAARRLIEHLLAPAEFVPAEVVDRLVRAGGGVPLHLVELARALRAAGAVRAGASPDAAFVAADELIDLRPTPLVQRLAARVLAGLPPAMIALVELCAVLGDPLDPAMVERTQAALRGLGRGERDQLDARVWLDRLVRASLLEPAAGGCHVFRHPMLREGIESLIAPAERRGLHRACLHALQAKAAALTPGAASPSASGLARRAHHAAGAGDHETAWRHHVELAELARVEHHHVDAEAQYTAALRQLAPADPRREAALAGRGRARARLERLGDALADLRAARTAAAARADRGAETALLLDEAMVLDLAQDFAGAAACAERAAQLIAQGAPVARGRLELARGRTAYRREQLGPAVEQLTVAAGGGGANDEHAPDAPVALGAPDADETRTVALLLLGPALVYAGRVAEAELRFAEVIARCEATGDAFHLAAACINRQVLWMKRRRRDLAIADLRRAQAIARELGNAQIERLPVFNLAELLYWQGDLEGALPLARRARQLQLRVAAGDHVPDEALLLARLHAARGEPAQAREWLDQVTSSGRTDALTPTARLLVRCVELRLAGGLGDAWHALAADAERHALLDERLEVLRAAADAARDAGRIDEAERLARQAAALDGGLPPPDDERDVAGPTPAASDPGVDTAATTVTSQVTPPVPRPNDSAPPARHET